MQPHPTVVDPSAELDRDRSRRFSFRVPAHWRSPTLKNPYAAEAERRVLAWFEQLGCSRAEVERARRFDIAGYVGVPFPSLSPDKTVRIAKHLSLWLLWDDVDVEILDERWRIDASRVITGRRPERMSRFEEGWWQLLTELAGSRSPRWIDDLCQAMQAWCLVAVEDSMVLRTYRERGVAPIFDRQLELRAATIGVHATVYLLEDAYDFELPRAFHTDPATVRLKTLAGEIVALGNDILGFGRDDTEEQLNLASTLMRERGLSIDAALERLVHMHDAALEEYDRLADALDCFPAHAASFVARWIQDLRYASLGFSMWESPVPRHRAFPVPKASCVPPRGTEPPASSCRASVKREA